MAASLSLATEGRERFYFPSCLKAGDEESSLFMPVLVSVPLLLPSAYTHVSSLCISSPSIPASIVSPWFAPEQHRMSTFTRSGDFQHHSQEMCTGRQSPAVPQPWAGSPGSRLSSPQYAAASLLTVLMDCNILTGTHGFQGCNQYTSPLATDVINDANTYFLINLPY